MITIAPTFSLYKQPIFSSHSKQVQDPKINLKQVKSSAGGDGGCSGSSDTVTHI